MVLGNEDLKTACKAAKYVGNGAIGKEVWNVDVGLCTQGQGKCKRSKQAA